MNKNGCITGTDFDESEVIITPSLDKLREINKNGKPIENDEITYLGKGVPVSKISKKKKASFVTGEAADESIPITIKDVDRSGHLGYIGEIAFDNTYLMENIIEQDIRKGYNVVVVNYTCNPFLLSKVYQVAAESGRLDDVMTFSLCFDSTLSVLETMSEQIIGESLIYDLLARLEKEQGVILFISTRTLWSNRATHLMGRVFLALLHLKLGARNFSPPLCLHINEAYMFLHPDPEDRFLHWVPKHKIYLNPDPGVNWRHMDERYLLLYSDIQQLFTKGGDK